MNKKGIIGDALDLLFLVMFSVFIFFFVYGALIASTNATNNQAIDQVVDFEEIHADLIEQHITHYNQYSYTKPQSLQQERLNE